MSTTVLHIPRLSDEELEQEINELGAHLALAQHDDSLSEEERERFSKAITKQLSIALELRGFRRTGAKVETEETVVIKSRERVTS